MSSVADWIWSGCCTEDLRLHVFRKQGLMFDLNRFMFILVFRKKPQIAYVSKFLKIHIKWVLNSILYISFYSKFCKPWIISEQNCKTVLTSLAARIVYASNCFTWSSRTRIAWWIGKCWWGDRMLSSAESDSYAGSMRWEKLVTQTSHAVLKHWQENTTELRILFFLKGIIEY